MDFVVSKVAMAICALLVVTVMTGLFAESAILGGGSGFEHVLDEFCELVDRAAAWESSVVWQAPFLPDGGEVAISIEMGVVLLESEDGTVARKPAGGLHLWHTDDRPLNSSMVRALDEGTGSLIFQSGQKVEILSKVLTCNQERRTFVFAYLLG